MKDNFSLSLYSDENILSDAKIVEMLEKMKLTSIEIEPNIVFFNKRSLNILDSFTM